MDEEYQLFIACCPGNGCKKEVIYYRGTRKSGDGICWKTPTFLGKHPTNPTVSLRETKAKEALRYLFADHGNDLGQFSRVARHLIF